MALALQWAREDSAHERANLIYTGKMEGRLEAKAEIVQIAVKMLAKNTPLDLIAEVTGLSMEEVNAIKEKVRAGDFKQL